MNSPLSTPHSALYFQPVENEDFNYSWNNCSGDLNCTFLNLNETFGRNGTFSNFISIGVATTILGIIIISTIIGNVFVITAVFAEKNLQTVQNYLIISLAAADLMVAVLVMPFGLLDSVSGSWMFGSLLCDVWTSSDVLCCTASILHLVAIAVDRYWAVSSLEYIRNRNKNRIVTMIVIIWTVAAGVSLPPLLGWKDPGFDERVEQDHKCQVSQDIGYQIFATMATFYVPLLVILLLYWKIWKVARKRIRHRPGKINIKQPGNKDVTIVCGSDNNKSGKSGKKSGSNCKMVNSISLSPCQPHASEVSELNPSNASNPSPELTPDNNQLMSELASPSTIELNIEEDPSNVEPTGGGSGEDEEDKVHMVNLSVSKSKPISTISSPSMSGPSKKRNKESIEAKREKKAAQTLAIITGAFVVCWVPFFLMALIMPLCQEYCYLPEYMEKIFLWLGYLNSFLNPIIYTIFSPEFRSAFKRILCSANKRYRK